MSSGNGFIKIHTFSQCSYSNTLKYKDGDVENCDISSGHGYMNSHTVCHQNGLKSLINYNNRDDIEMNAASNNGYLSHVIV